ncbi:hypothetical protein DNTS_032567 [Danionella cerebrum]|uniref:Uncharacterized protein n=1 Tax=Danionella cerebrum TaxID=2873325 RepID=A0A553PY52_9TELE|nr:hypothetical protein DNTS_032567 [Danionella translucida]
MALRGMRVMKMQNRRILHQ